MRPELFEIFGFSVPAFVSSLAFAYLVGILLMAKLARRRGLDADVVIDFGLYAVFVSLFGARLAHVFFDGFFTDYVNLCLAPDRVVWQLDASACSEQGGRWHTASQTCHAQARDCFAWARFWSGGLTFYGGLLAATGFGIFYFRRHGFRLTAAADLAACALPLGHFFGRLGCFFTGCCFGETTNGFWGVTFPPGSPASVAQARAGLIASRRLPSLPVHPTQLYEAAGLALIFVVMLWLYTKRLGKDGQVFASYLLSYGLLRFAVELVRADPRGAAWGLSTSQWIALGGIALGGILFRRFETPARRGML